MLKKKDAGSASNTIDSYRKRQQRGPIVIWGLAVLLVVVGVIILVVWFTGDNKPEINLFATETPTPTLTATPTMTASPTATSTYTMTPTITLTPTASAPFSYIVQEGEYLYSIVDKFVLGDSGIALLYLLNPKIEAADGIVYPGDEILIPNPDMKLPTATPVPVDLPRGTELEYRIQPGDTIAAIAEKFHSTADDIIALNELEDVNAIQVSQILIVPANMVTPAPTRLPPTTAPDVTPTLNPEGIATSTPVATSAASTPAATTVATASCAYDQNPAYVAQIFDLLNTERLAQGLQPLTENAALTTAAQDHAADMACNDYWKDFGSDGSTLADWLGNVAYTATFSAVEVHAQPPEYGGDGQAAVKAWVADGDALLNLLNADATELGIGYAYSAESSYGGYFTLILAAPAE